MEDILSILIIFIGLAISFVKVIINPLAYIPVAALVALAVIAAAIIPIAAAIILIAAAIILTIVLVKRNKKKKAALAKAVDNAAEGAEPDTTESAAE